MKSAIRYALLLVPLFLGTITAFAAESEGGTSFSDAASRFDWGAIFRKVDLTISTLLEGPTLAHLDGNLNGQGGSVVFKNYINAQYQLAEGINAEIGGEFRQFFRPENPAQPDRADFEARDPFLAVNFRDFIRKKTFSISSRHRYYVPVSNDTKSRVGKAFDTGRGNIQNGFAANWRSTDGAWSVTVPCDLYVNFAKAPIAAREDFSLKAKLQVAYRLHQKVSLRAEYSTGDVRHIATGKWTKLNDRFTGHKVMAGVAFFPTRQLMINPSLAMARDSWRWDRAEATLFASYNFR
jgi:hypothetical protein